MLPMTYIEHVWRVMHNMVTDGKDTVRYDRVIAQIVTYKRWRRERPAPHHRRLIHKALMREVWAGRLSVTGSGMHRIVKIVDGINFYQEWEEPDDRVQLGPMLRIAPTKEEVLERYKEYADLLLVMNQAIANWEGNEVSLEYRGLPRKIRELLVAERRHRRRNAELNQQVYEGDLRIQQLTVELRRRGTAVTASTTE